MNIKKGRSLHCGCCGAYFKTWEGYRDQDQDKGYGICQPCQADISDKNEAEFDKAIEVLRSGLNDKNRAKFNALNRDTQKAFVRSALDEGILTYHIARR